MPNRLEALERLYEAVKLFCASDADECAAEEQGVFDALAAVEQAAPEKCSRLNADILTDDEHIACPHFRRDLAGAREAIRLAGELFGIILPDDTEETFPEYAAWLALPAVKPELK